MSVSAPNAARTALLLSVSTLAMLVSAPALADPGNGNGPPPTTPPGQTNPPAQGQGQATQGQGQAKFQSLITTQGGGVTPSYGDIDAFGDINAFGGDINAFAGDINAFWGDVNPYGGDINAFGGDINAFGGDINAFGGDINAFWGDIDAFWGDIDAFHGGTATTLAYGDVGVYWRDIGPLWTDTVQKWGALGTYAAGDAGYAQVQTQFNDFLTRSESTWGAAVTAKTGQSFRAGFADAVLAKHGINPNDPSTFAGKTANDRGHFFLDWYDGLMNFTGVDHIDHWMGQVRWTPQITQIQGRGAGTIIGLLDATLAGDPDVANNITSAEGFTNALDGHGVGVASLMVADHDGQGVMGIAPNASVVSYNPFDSTGTASWLDVRTGIGALQNHGASVINMSLGIAGWTLHSDWKEALASASTNNTIFVIAAGNSGVSQTTDIAWNFNQDPVMLVVGSVDLGGHISDFSNRPGTACLLDNGSCTEAHRLYNRFMVAPGELILLADGQGGLTRRSGTSFSAPLVSGAITLLHDRWPWLVNYPHETAEIMLRSAKDLGAPGPDEVYGWGLLDVEASQSPLDFNALTFYEYRNGVMVQKTASQVKAGGLDTTWDADGVYFRLFETIGATHRDFAVPMASRLVGQKSNVTGSEEYFQSYIHARLTGWISGTNGFSDVVTDVRQQPGQWSFAVSTAIPQAPLGREDLATEAPHMALRMADPTGRFAFSAGRGQGAMVLGELAGFTQTRDYASADGGVNPILGFASGGAFADVDVALSKRTTLSIGGAERTLVHRRNAALTDYEREVLRNVDDYKAGALNVRLTHQVNDTLTLSAGYARLNEANGLLGVQSTEAGDLGHGSVSDVATVGASLQLPRGMTFAATASAGQTRTAGGADQNLASVGAVATSAYAVSFTKHGLVGKNDLFRVAFTQPLTVERGTLAFTSVEVVDRTTGEIGPVTRTFDITTKPRHVAETLYATPVFSGQGELSLFGRAEFQSGQPVQDYMAGARLNLNF